VQFARVQLRYFVRLLYTLRYLAAFSVVVCLSVPYACAVVCVKRLSKVTRRVLSGWSVAVDRQC